MEQFIKDIESNRIITNTFISDKLLPNVINTFRYSFNITITIKTGSLTVCSYNIKYKLLCKKNVTLFTKTSNIIRENCYIYVVDESSNGYLSSTGIVLNSVKTLNIICIPIDVENINDFFNEVYSYKPSGNTGTIISQTKLNDGSNSILGNNNSNYVITFESTYQNGIKKYISENTGIKYGNNYLGNENSSLIIEGIENTKKHCLTNVEYYNIFGYTYSGTNANTKCIKSEVLKKIKTNNIYPVIGSVYYDEDDGYYKSTGKIHKMLHTDDLNLSSEEILDEYGQWPILLVPPVIPGYKQYLNDIQGNGTPKVENISINQFIIEEKTSFFGNDASLNIYNGINNKTTSNVIFDDYYIYKFKENNNEIVSDGYIGTNNIFLKYTIKDIYSGLVVSSKPTVSNMKVENIKATDKLCQGDILLGTKPIIVPGIMENITSISDNIYYHKLSYIDVDTAKKYYVDPNTFLKIEDEIEEDSNGNAIIPVKVLKSDFYVDSAKSSIDDKLYAGSSSTYMFYKDKSNQLVLSLTNGYSKEIRPYITIRTYQDWATSSFVNNNDITEDELRKIIENAFLGTSYAYLEFTLYVNDKIVATKELGNTPEDNIPLYIVDYYTNNDGVLYAILSSSQQGSWWLGTFNYNIDTLTRVDIKLVLSRITDEHIKNNFNISNKITLKRYYKNYTNSASLTNVIGDFDYE